MSFPVAYKVIRIPWLNLSVLEERRYNIREVPSSYPANICNYAKLGNNVCVSETSPLLLLGFVRQRYSPVDMAPELTLGAVWGFCFAFSGRIHPCDEKSASCHLGHVEIFLLCNIENGRHHSLEISESPYLSFCVT